MAEIDFSVIIPHKNSIGTLSRLLFSIPGSERIEIIVVDNSEVPISKEDIRADRSFKLFFSEPSRFAGGARNVGLTNSLGKWILFADADDYFVPGAFDCLSKYVNSNCDIVYFGSRSFYEEDGSTSLRSAQYNEAIAKYQEGAEKDKNKLAVEFKVPWAKMIRRDFIERYSLRFDEVKTSNDAFFSVASGYYARKIEVDPSVVYAVSDHAGSLTKLKDYESIRSRYRVTMQINRFLREKGLNHYQQSVAIYLYTAMKHYPSKIPIMILEAVKSGQSIFVGARNWCKTYNKIK